MSTSSAERLDTLRQIAEQMIAAHDARDAGALLGAAGRVSGPLRDALSDWDTDLWNDVDPMARFGEWAAPTRSGADNG